MNKEVWCMKCKKKVNAEGSEVVKKNVKGDTLMFMGKCPKCDTTVCQILGKVKPTTPAKICAVPEQKKK